MLLLRRGDLGFERLSNRCDLGLQCLSPRGLPGPERRAGQQQAELSGHCLSERNVSSVVGPLGLEPSKRQNAQLLAVVTDGERQVAAWTQEGGR